MRRRAPWIGCALLLGLLAGCGRKATPPLAPESPLPPEIEDVFPPPRSTGNSYETEIWARFAEPLDSTTVNPDNVILYLDTQRIPTTVSWEAPTRRIVIRPLAPLALERTHTVRLEPDLATAKGGRLGHEYFWQFKTAALRTPYSPFPPDGAVNESPFVTLTWGDAGPGGDDVAYDLFIGADSAGIASRSVAPTRTSALTYFLPDQKLAPEAVVYWSLRAHNLTTREQLDGPVWRFRVVPADAPVDSVVLSPSDWASFDPLDSLVTCLGNDFLVGGRWTATMRWSLASLGPLKLAYAAMRLRYRGSPQAVQVLAANNYWPACDLSHLVSGRALAVLNAVSPPIPMLYASSDALSAHLEATLRHKGFQGYVLQAIGPEMTLQEFGSQLTLYYYKE